MYIAMIKTLATIKYFTTQHKTACCDCWSYLPSETCNGKHPLIVLIETLGKIIRSAPPRTQRKLLELSPPPQLQFKVHLGKLLPSGNYVFHIYLYWWTPLGWVYIQWRETCLSDYLYIKTSCIKWPGFSNPFAMIFK